MTMQGMHLQRTYATPIIHILPMIKSSTHMRLKLQLELISRTLNTFGLVHVVMAFTILIKVK